MAEDWQQIAHDLWMEGNFEMAEAPCEFSEQGDDACDPQDPECEPCALRAVLERYHQAEENSSSTSDGTVPLDLLQQDRFLDFLLDELTQRAGHQRHTTQLNLARWDAKAALQASIDHAKEQQWI